MKTICKICIESRKFIDNTILQSLSLTLSLSLPLPLSPSHHVARQIQPELGAGGDESLDDGENLSVPVAQQL